MKKSDSFLKEYVSKLSDDDLGFLNVRFKQNMFGDRADIANLVSRDQSVDRWLSNATNADDWFNKVESVGEYVHSERSRREDSHRNSR